MKKFKIIPVIDILNSEVVHAIKGEREKYQPLKSVLVNNSNPIKVIERVKIKTLISEVYIADLDAILKKRPNFSLLRNILKIPQIKVMIDPGIVSIKDVLDYSSYDLDSLILGLETIQNIKVISDCLEIMGSNKTIVSIDMYKETIQTSVKELKNQDTFNIIKNLEDLGVRIIILLDLYKVGQKLGGIPPLYLELNKFFNGQVLAGGGIKNFEDIELYKQNGFSGVLIGTALHDGTIEPEKLRKINLI
ncbi:MAG: HisA/HisF-related TIM barrel protein [Candidatus Hermodarchaeota archaeon]